MERENAAGEAETPISLRFQRLYPILKSELLDHPAFQHDSLSLQWVEAILDKNVPAGNKLHRGLAVVETYFLLKGNGERDRFQSHEEEEVTLALVLGWCIQWLVRGELVLDDIVDKIHTRGDRQWWFNLPEIGNKMAVNDGVWLWNHVNVILKRHFREKSYYVDLLELFNEVEYQSASGEMLNLISREKDFSMFTLSLHRSISKCKTGYATFYLPFGCALLLGVERLEEYDYAKELLLEMGVYSQVRDDYFDCFGDSENVGKVGMDMKDFKCSWLIVKALELCNGEQRRVLEDNYGQVDIANVEAVKEVYRELNLEDVYTEYEIEVYVKLMARIEVVPSNGVKAVLKSYLDKIHRSRK